ncbi:SWI/SNF complex subunit SWI3C [Camellia lanceoleosa]|uniref:SWI/SNF complex subunit SWI3C n=1 Tax=Camellia lanceoleosa TaxID=1840588 RepID=A0ACC0HQG7_9ERIC|nr:SWI/SNF complex subunit SWI3C [Camellia lanceoleosa]
MPASSSETRTRWRKKRKREAQIGRRSKPQDDDIDDDEEDDDDLEQQQPEFDEDQQNPQSGPDPPPISRESEVLSDGGVRISDFPPVIKHTVNRPHSSVLAIVALERAIQCGEVKNLQNGVVLENISHGQLQALSAVPAAGDQERADGSSSTTAYVIAPPPIMEGRGVVKRFGGNRVHVVPMHADWFSPSTVHRLERQVVPHFFSGKSADHMPEKYMECRNSIVAKYMENPETRLSVDDCQGLVAGVDIDDLTRIFRFLDNWGIINYCAAAPRHDHRIDGLYLREDSTGEVQVPSAALKSINSLIQFDKPKCSLKAADVYPSLSCHDVEESDLDSRIMTIIRKPMQLLFPEPTLCLLSVAEGGSCLEDPDSEHRLPFANFANPVMALVAFLASAVGPRVAAACAHVSLAVLSEDSQTASGHGNRMNMESTRNSEGSSHGENTNSSQQKEDNLEVHSQWNQNGEAAPLTAEKVRSAAKAGLAAAATKAKLFADHEEREIQRLSANIINHQLKRLELKLKQFAEVETMLMKECEQVERARQRIAAERTRITSAQFGPAAVTSSTSLPGIVGPSMVNNTANNRQPVIAGTSSQPFISGYGNNQPIHPQFMARQQMYGLGPRLPLSALHPSSSAAPNAMFNAATNAQPTLNHPMLRPVSGTSSGLG